MYIFCSASILSPIKILGKRKKDKKGVTTATLMRICDPLCHALYGVRGLWRHRNCPSCAQRVGEMTEGKRDTSQTRICLLLLHRYKELACTHDLSLSLPLYLSKILFFSFILIAITLSAIEYSNSYIHDIIH